MKVVLVNLPWKKGNRWGVRAGSRWPHLKDHTESNYMPFPFYLAYAAALLKREGFDVCVIDCIAAQIPYERFYRQIAALRPDLLAVETSTVTLRHDLRCLRRLNPGLPVCLCGPDVNIAQPEFFRGLDNVGYVLYGEYEAGLLELARAVRDKGKPEHIAGLIYRDHGRVMKNPARPLLNDLDRLPWPLREQLPLRRYNDSPGDIPVPSVSMWSSRGCPFRCSFCLWPQVMYGGSSYRTRNAVCVVDEMEYLVKKLGFKSVYFDDDTWNIGRERMFAFTDELRRRGLRVPWAIMARAELMDEEILERLRAAGLFAVKYGVESASQQLLNNIGKGTDLKKAAEVVKYTKYLGIRTHLTFTFGLPQENQSTLKETVRLALKLNPASVQFSLATPFPGTRFYEEMNKAGFIRTRDWEKFDGNHTSVIRTEHLSARQLQAAKKNAYAIWEKHCRTRHTKAVPAAPGLREKFVVCRRQNGMAAALRKTARYLLRRLLLLPLRLRERLSQRLWLVEETLCGGGLKLCFGEQRVNLFRENEPVSKNVGLTTSFYCGGRWLDSSQANWKIEKHAEQSVCVKLKWDEVPVRQQWRISLAGAQTLQWRVEMFIEEELEILEYKAGIMVRPEYNHWQDDLGRGRFPPVRGWEEIELYNCSSRKLCVLDTRRNARRLPELELTLAAGQSGAAIYPQIQNTDKKTNARILQMRQFKIDRFLPGRCDCGSLTLRLKNGHVPERPAAAAGANPGRFLKEQAASCGTWTVVKKIARHMHPRALSGYYGEIIGVLDGQYAYKGPAFVQIDLTNDCNNDCLGCWCNSPLLKEKKISSHVKRQTLPFEVVKKTIDGLARMGTKEIYFAGGGEPFMHPRIIPIIEHVKARGLKCFINTNFTLLTEETVKKLAELEVDNLVVSVWAGTAETYRDLHPNKSAEMFYQIKGMLKLLNALKKQKPRVNVYNVISNRNYRELEEMVGFGLETNSESVEFTVIDTIPRATDKLMLSEEQRLAVREICGRIAARLEKEWKNRIVIQQFEQFVRRIESAGAAGADYDKDVLADMPCYTGWMFSRILADGSVNFCLKAHRIPVGNIYAHDFSVIWNSRRQREFRRRALNAKKDDVFFSFIGNDPAQAVGCFKSCDDLARNMRMHKKIRSLTALELRFLRAVLLIKKTQRYLKEKNLTFLLRERLKKNSPAGRIKLQQGRLSVVYDADCLRLFWDGTELTQSVGLSASVCVFGLWYDSSRAGWTLQKRTAEELILENNWQSIPVRQRWQLRLEGKNRISWKIWMRAASKMEIGERKVSIMLSPRYRQWRLRRQKGRFPAIRQWREIILDDAAARQIVVEEAPPGKSKLPGVCLDFSRENGTMIPQLQNSDREINARVISARCVSANGGDVFLPGEYKFFEGEIIVGAGDEGSFAD